MRQVRKYTGEPYIVHPIEVENILVCYADNPVSPEQRAAAYLHDVVEDTGVTIELILEQFGPKVAELVGYLTDVSKPEDGNRKVRKAIDREHIAQASPEAQSVKIADLCSNTRTIVAYDPDFARVYLGEKKKLLEVLQNADPGLVRYAQVSLDASYRTLYGQ
jgi:(p)ppGpp synthase/HD superfamily hydrolase